MATVEQKRALAALVLALDDDETPAHVVAVMEGDSAIATVASTHVDGRGGRQGRVWDYCRNDRTWLTDTAIGRLSMTPCWRALFRVSLQTFEVLQNALTPHIQRKTTRYRPPIPAAHKIAAFLMYCGGATCEATATQLGIGASSVNSAVKELSIEIINNFKDNIRFPVTEDEVARAASGFQGISGLPYCVGAIDGTHVPWPACPTQQFYEYRCYKGYPSVVIFATCTADRRITFADVGRPGVLGDSTIFERSALRAKIREGAWLGTETPDLVVGDVKIRPYLMGDCAFTLDTFMMKTSSKTEQNANPILKSWDPIAANTRKPIECSFGMLKNRFEVLRVGVKMLHEDEVARLCLACIHVHNECIRQGDDNDVYLPQDDEEDDEEHITVETNAGKKQREALLHYVIRDRMN